MIVMEYVLELHNILSKVYEFPLQNLNKFQVKMKRIYELQSQERKFSVRDIVIPIIPTANNPLTAKFMRPFRIDKVMKNNNYITNTPDRRKSHKLIHVNRLKRYHYKKKSQCKFRQI